MKIPYDFPVYTVDSCPLSKSAWETRSRSLNCSNDFTNTNRYFCMPNSKLTSLVEFCYDTIRPMVEKDYCIVLADSGTIDYRGCLHFTDGCPADNYFSDTVYNYPMCLEINGKKSCFTASPECNETHATSDTTTSSYVPSSVYREINSSFSDFLLTTTHTSSYGDSSHDKISTLPIILILVTVLVLLCIALGLYIKFRGHVLQMCKKRNDYAADNGTSEEMVRFLSNDSVVENNTSTDGMTLPATSHDDSLSDDSQGEEYDEIKTNIESRRVGDKTYICNNGVRTQIKVMVTSKNIVMVSGGPGSGKKFTLWHIAFLLEKDGYEVVQVNRLDEITTYENTSKRQVFVCENPFGLFYLDKELLQYLDRSDDLICISNKKSKIVFTCRSDICQHVKKWTFYKYINVIDLNEPLFRWQNEERRDLFSRICKQNGLSETVQNLPDNDFYPLSCHLFSEITKFQEQKANYFQKPLESIMCFLDDLKRNNKLLYDTLIICLFLENSRSDEMDILNTIKPALCVSDVEGYMNKIEEEMKRSNIFLTTKNDTKFGFKNGLLFEVIAFHYGMSHAVHILLHMDIHFLSKKVQVSENKQNLSTDLVIALKKTDLVPLAERLLKELENLNPYDVFSVHCWSNSDFMNEFLTLLSKKSYEEIKSIFLEETNLSIKCYVLPLNERVKDAKNLENIAWYRQKLLEDRQEDYTWDSRVHYTRSIRVLNWIVANAQTELLKFIIDKLKENENDIYMRLFGSGQIEQTRSLVLACFSDSDETVELVMQFFNKIFINKTCDVKNWKKKKERLNIHRKFTPLTAACFAISLPIVKIIIGKGANVNQMDENGNLPLTLASQIGSLSVVEYLVNHAADVNECDIWERSALMCAAEGGSRDVVSFLITKTPNIDACDENGQSSLYRACKRGHLNIVCKLLENNANVNLCDKENKSPLYWASQIGHLEIVKKLVAKGAKVNLCDKKKKSSLYCASKRGYFDVVVYLVEHHAAIDSCTMKMRSPLFRASKRGYLDIVKYLLAKGTNVNKTDERGESPLYCASKRGHIEIVKELLENKAYVDILNVVHQTALYWAAQKGHFEIAKMLIFHNPNINHVDAMDKREKSPLYCASKRGYLPIVKLLLEANADVNACNINGKSSLYRASKRGHLDVVKYLVQKKADVNQCDKDGKSPLYWASLRGNSKIVNFLVKNKARVNQCDKTYCSPLYVAAKNGHLDVVKILCGEGADINKTDPKGKSALDLAYRKGHHDIVEFLRRRRAM